MTRILRFVITNIIIATLFMTAKLTNAQQSTVSVTVTVTGTEYTTETVVLNGVVTITDTAVSNIIIGMRLEDPTAAAAFGRNRHHQRTTLLNSIPTNATCIYLRYQS